MRDCSHTCTSCFGLVKELLKFLGLVKQSLTKVPFTTEESEILPLNLKQEADTGWKITPGILICKQFYGWKIKKKIWNQFATYISSTNSLANCLWSPNFMQKKSEKTTTSFPGHLTFLMLVICYALQKLCNERSYKFRWILTLTAVIRIRILLMRIISTILNFYWSHAIPLQKLS